MLNLQTFNFQFSSCTAYFWNKKKTFPACENLHEEMYFWERKPMCFQLSFSKTLGRVLKQPSACFKSTVTLLMTILSAEIWELITLLQCAKSDFERRRSLLYIRQVGRNKIKILCYSTLVDVSSICTLHHNLIIGKLFNQTTYIFMQYRLHTLEQ